MDTKICKGCGVEKPIETGFWWRHDQNAYSATCKECRAKKQAARYLVVKEHHAKVVKARYDTYGRFRRYGITQEMYEAALHEQDGKCKLCGAAEPGGKGVWHIDHAHPPGAATQNGRFNQTDDPGRFRGLLCHRCNVSLGHYELLVERLGEDRLMRYLHPELEEVTLRLEKMLDVGANRLMGAFSDNQVAASDTGKLHSSSTITYHGPDEGFREL